MAAGKFNMQKASGGVASITVADGTTNTAVVLPERGTVATTDNIVGFKNYIINGGFNVNQYPAFSNSSDGYKFDRWLIIGASNIGAATCGNLQNGVDGAITMSNKGLYFTKTGTGDSWISQRIENPTKLSGRTVTLSFKAYSGVAMNADVYFDSYNPTNGITTNFGSLKQAFTLLVGWNTYSFTFKLPVIGANYTNIASYLQLNLHMLSGSTTTGAWISDVQLEEGSVATPFDNRPYGLELSLCQRYYEILTNVNTPFVMYTPNGDARVSIPFKVQKRIVPECTISGTINSLAVGKDADAVNIALTISAIIAKTVDGIYSISVTNPSVLQYCGIVVSGQGHCELTAKANSEL